MAEKVQHSAKTAEVKRENSASKTRAMDYSQSMSSPLDHVMYLQRMAGNQVVQRLMKSGALQAKLRIGAPGDVYEQEADRVADAVVRMPEPKMVTRQKGDPSECSDCGSEELRRQPEEEEFIQPEPLADQITPLVQRQVEGEEEEQVQTKTITEQITSLVQRQNNEDELLQTKKPDSQFHEIKPSLTTRIQSMKGGGHSLPGSTRSFFEPRFGRNFSQVRVHTDTQAAESARALNARAFTVGEDVVFGVGQFAPESLVGQKLLAHELTHVIQQGSAGKHIQKQGFKSPISFRERLFSRWFKLPAALSLKAIIDTQRVPKGCAMPSKYNVYLFNHSTKRYETTVSYEIDKRQTFTWKGLTSGNYQFILRAPGNIAVDCKLQGTIEVKHEPAINQIIPVAKGHVGSSTWAYSAKKHPYGSNTNKCNLFIYDVLNQAGASVQMKKRDRGWLKGLIKDRYVYHPPLAGQWANPGVSIPGWIVVKTPQVGDVAAETIQYSNATGHVGIVSEVTLGGKNGKTISATDKKVVENDWGFRSGQNVVFRRYKGR